MKLRPIQSAPVFGTMLLLALMSSSSVWAKPPDWSHQTFANSPRIDVGLAAVGAAARADLQQPRTWHRPGSDASKIWRHTPVTPTAPAALNPFTFISARERHLPERVRPYVTIQPPSLVVTAAMHRRLTTTSAAIPAPYSGTTTILQVRRIDRFVNQTAPDVTQTILPAHVVDRGIDFGYGNKGSASTPEPAPGIILIAGVLGVGALVIARKRRIAVR